MLKPLVSKMELWRSPGVKEHGPTLDKDQVHETIQILVYVHVCVYKYATKQELQVKRFRSRGTNYEGEREHLRRGKKASTMLF